MVQNGWISHFFWMGSTISWSGPTKITKTVQIISPSYSSMGPFRWVKSQFKLKNMWIRRNNGGPHIVLKVDLKVWKERCWYAGKQEVKKTYFVGAGYYRWQRRERALKMRKRGNEMERFSLLEELSWRQKLRVLWLREGHRCTEFTRWLIQIGEATMWIPCNGIEFCNHREIGIGGTIFLGIVHHTI